MITFPESTLVGKPVPKTAFYKNLEVNAKMKQRFVDDVASVTWVAKIAPSTLNVADGKTVHEITVFRMVLKKEEVPSDVLTLIDKQMPRHTVFMLQYDDKQCLYVNYKEWHDAEQRQFDIVKTYQTAWMKDADIVLAIEGSTMDAVFSSFVRQIAGGLLDANRTDLHTAVMADKEREQLQKSINILERQMRKEKQPRKRFEMHQRLVIMKAKLNQ
uniref:DUF4391 domain-containing protein n=1 Tax=Prevotella sp. TaxID=59823 RepID=UPI004026B891